MSASVPYEPVPAAPPPKASVWEDLVDIWYAPSTVFQRRENGNFGIALVVLTVVVTALFFASRGALAPIFDAQMAKQMDLLHTTRPEMTADQLATARTMSEKVASFAFVGVMIGTPVAVFVIGLIAWVVGKFVGATQSLRSAFVVSTFAAFPWMLASLATLVQGLVLDLSNARSMFAVSVSPARFLDASTTSPVVIALASRVDPFTIWWAVLIAIGARITGKLTTNQAAIVGVVMWLLGALPTIYAASRGQI